MEAGRAEQPHDGAEPSAELALGRQHSSSWDIHRSSQRESPLSIITCGHFSSTRLADAPSTARNRVALQWAGEAGGGGAGHGAKLSFVCLGWWQCRVLLGSLRFLVAPILRGNILPSVLAGYQFSRDRGARARQ